MKASTIAIFVSLGLIMLSSSTSVYALTSNNLPMQRADTSGSSTNWSGYAITGPVGSVTNASASWIVPSVKCGSTGNYYSAFWVGIDGYTSSTVEQTGTDSDCHSGVASYYAWYEFYPKNSFNIPGITVSPGDTIVASVSYSGGLFTVSIRDVTSGGAFTTSSAVPAAQQTSAEFIAEAPAICSLTACHLAALSDFGKVVFGMDNTGIKATCYATISGVTGSIGSFGSSVASIKMVSASNQNEVKAQPSALSSDGTSFGIKWEQAT